MSLSLGTRYGTREAANITLRTKVARTICGKSFAKHQPVLYIDTAKTSTLEGASTTVYAQGGRGNPRLIAWEGERTLTFTFEDALISPLSFSLLSGSNLIMSTSESEEKVHVHTSIEGVVETSGSALVIDVTDALGANEDIDNTTYIFVMKTMNGGFTGDTATNATYANDTGTGKKKVTVSGGNLKAGDGVLIDCYIAKAGKDVAEIQINGEDFAGAYYVEFETMFREYGENSDHPAIFTIPNAKLQSNFNFSFAGTGDPSTFTFTMDAFPGYTLFNPAKRVLCACQIVGDAAGTVTSNDSVFPHSNSETAGTTETSGD